MRNQRMELNDGEVVFSKTGALLIVRQKAEMDSHNILLGNITEIFTLRTENSLAKHFDRRFTR